MGVASNITCNRCNFSCNFGMRKSGKEIFTNVSHTHSIRYQLIISLIRTSSMTMTQAIAESYLWRERMLCTVSNMSIPIGELLMQIYLKCHSITYDPMIGRTKWSQKEWRKSIKTTCYTKQEVFLRFRCKNIEIRLGWHVSSNFVHSSH